MEYIIHNTELTDNEILELISEKNNNIDIENLEITKKDILFPSSKDAINYLEDMSKIYNTITTQFLEAIENFDETDISKSLKEKIDLSINNYINFPEILLERFAKQKSSTKGCTNCKSTINKDFYKDKIQTSLDSLEYTEDTEEYSDILKLKMDTLKCPICDSEEFLITDTDKEKISKLENAIEKETKKYDEEAISFQIKTGQKTVSITFYQEAK